MCVASWFSVVVCAELLHKSVKKKHHVGTMPGLRLQEKAEERAAYKG